MKHSIAVSLFYRPIKVTRVVTIDFHVLSGDFYEIAENCERDCLPTIPPCSDGYILTTSKVLLLQ